MMKKRDLEDRAYLLRRKRVDDKSRYNQIQKRLVNDSEIIFTTLSSAGSERLEKYKGQFACLIVDEAGQCTEPNLLIALQLNIPKVLLIGDPCQLPATTFSPDSNITLFNRSMFERMIDGGLRPYFLDIQYRMTPQIRYFPSKCFYNARLTDDYSVRTR
jgi:senataxin